MITSLSNMGEVKLHGFWYSPFTNKVIWALKLKGIPFEYIEEDVFNKSPLLLQYNPVHKQTPVLVHGGKPICESMIIVEYIEEVWPEKPLMPSDPYRRAMARFWIKFLEDKPLALRRALHSTTAEEHEQIKKDSLEFLKTIEEHRAGETKFFIGDEFGIVDIAFGAFAYWLEITEEILGVKLLEAQKFPKLTALINNFKEKPVIKENLPDQHELLVYFKGRRERFLASAS